MIGAASQQWRIYGTQANIEGEKCWDVLSRSFSILEIYLIHHFWTVPAEERFDPKYGPLHNNTLFTVGNLGLDKIRLKKLYGIFFARNQSINFFPSCLLGKSISFYTNRFIAEDDTRVFPDEIYHYESRSRLCIASIWGWKTIHDHKQSWFLFSLDFGP